MHIKKASAFMPIENEQKLKLTKKVKLNIFNYFENTPKRE